MTNLHLGDVALDATHAQSQAVPAPAGMTRRQYREYLAQASAALASAPATTVQPPPIPSAAAPVARSVEAHTGMSLWAGTNQSAPTPPATRRSRREALRAEAELRAVPPTPNPYNYAVPAANAVVAEPEAAASDNWFGPGNPYGDYQPEAFALPPEWQSPSPTTSFDPLPSRRDLRKQAPATSTTQIIARQALRASADVLRRPANGMRTRNLQKVGVVSALGVATIITPVMAQNAIDFSDGSGANTMTMGHNPGADAAVGLNTPVQQSDLAAANASRVAGSLPNGVVEPLPLAAPAAAGVVVASNPAAAQIQQVAARPAPQVLLPGCVNKPNRIPGANGRLPGDDLCQLWQQEHRLRADAALALARLNEAYRAKFGENISITDSYRSYAEQVSVKRRKPGLAAVPGTSEHGWGLAVDLGGGIPDGGERYRWMRKNAPQFGWDNPAWARAGGRGPYEPWHWEFVAGQAA